jgi:hypothetical protein
MGHQPKASELYPCPPGMSDRAPRLTVAFNPRALGSFWVTQITVAGLDFAMLTGIFGNSVSMTWERYLKVDKSRLISQWTRDWAKAIAEGTDYVTTPSSWKHAKPFWPPYRNAAVRCPLW